MMAIANASGEQSLHVVVGRRIILGGAGYLMLQLIYDAMVYCTSLWLLLHTGANSV
jgi:hypothetical protein